MLGSERTISCIILPSSLYTPVSRSRASRRPEPVPFFSSSGKSFMASEYLASTAAMVPRSFSVRNPSRSAACRMIGDFIAATLTPDSPFVKATP